MLQQQINYWTLRESMRHNRVGEGISQQDADTNRINANTNIFNAQVNAINATSNRIQANAATVQAGAAVRQAGAAERQASVQERNVTVTEKLQPSKEFNNYASPFGSALGNGVNLVGTGLKGLKGTKLFGGSSTTPKIGKDGFYVNPSVAPSAIVLGTGVWLPTPEEQAAIAKQQTGLLEVHAKVSNFETVW